jgi:hypothetical protein
LTNRSGRDNARPSAIHYIVLLIRFMLARVIVCPYGDS